MWAGEQLNSWPQSRPSCVTIWAKFETVKSQRMYSKAAVPKPLLPCLTLPSASWSVVTNGLRKWHLVPPHLKEIWPKGHVLGSTFILFFQISLHVIKMYQQGVSLWVWWSITAVDFSSVCAFPLMLMTFALFWIHCFSWLARALTQSDAYKQGSLVHFSVFISIQCSCCLNVAYVWECQCCGGGVTISDTTTSNTKTKRQA